MAFKYCKLLGIIVALSSLSTKPVLAQAPPSHPFLIVDESMYQNLISKADSSPWLEMKANAITNAQEALDPKWYDTALNLNQRSRQIRHIVSSASLSYILDPGNKAEYVGYVLDAISKWDNMNQDLSLINCGDSWSNSVPVGFSFFNSVLALDIVYNDLTPTQLQQAENSLQSIADWFWNPTNNNCNDSWPLNTYSARGIWSLYKGDRINIDLTKNSYKVSLLGYLTNNGSFSEGPGYAWHRLSADIDNKSLFMDVLEFTGEESYYQDPTIRNFFDWIYGSTLSPIRHKLTFGDTSSEFWNRTVIEQPALLRAHKFSSQAGGNASWILDNQLLNADGYLLHYLLLDESLTAPTPPTSSIWPESLASFWEPNPSPNSLMGALWNPIESGAHSHKDVNSIHITAFGEDVLRNVGYAGWGLGCAGSTWNYVNNSAISSNTVLIDNTDHNAKQGAGITEGFTSPSLDYASANSGNALPNGEHLRNFIFVPPQNGYLGYYVLYDEVAPINPLSQINVILHPNSDSFSAITPQAEYQWTINQYSGQDVFLTIFQATPPTSVTVSTGGLCAQVPGYQSIAGQYLNSAYSTSANGKKNITSLIIPHNATSPKPTLSRVTDTDYTGAMVDFGNSTIDHILESSSINAINYGNVQLQASATWYRETSGNLDAFFVRNGTKLVDALTGIGFESLDPVSLHFNDTTGAIVSPGTELTIYDYDITSISLDGNLITITSSDPGTATTAGYAKAIIPRGTWDISYTNQGEPPPLPSPTPSLPSADLDGDGDVDSLDYQQMLTDFGRTDTPAADFDASGLVDVFDFNLLVGNFGS